MNEEDELRVLYMLACGLEETLAIYSNGESFVYDEEGKWLYRHGRVRDQFSIYSKGDMKMIIDEVFEFHGKWR